MSDGATDRAAGRARDAAARAAGQIEAMEKVLGFIDRHPGAGRGEIAEFCDRLASGRNRVIGRLSRRPRAPGSP